MTNETDALRDRCKLLQARLIDAREALADIADYAHHFSTGPAEPDWLWDIRTKAYDALDRP